MEASVITITIRTGPNTKRLSLTLSSAYNINLEPGPGPTMTTLLLGFDDGSIAVSGDAIDFQIAPVVPPELPLSPVLSSTTSTQPSSPLSPNNLSLNRLSLGSRTSNRASISRQEAHFEISVRIQDPPQIVVVNVSASDTVAILRRRILDASQMCPPRLFYRGVDLAQKGASLGFYKIGPGAEIVGRSS
ncbi:hypothetical protein EMPS_11140 [Entomortierella parvispora]|uniref:Ubiquitin-like domain-containing protein n=1 Tax=Entomortierella parvispora TaxID=205924 RepID=A0A9P3HLD1_9FUNG|nr:hypothetical protein EMPS_11140 [Entomortierella parvispora]